MDVVSLERKSVLKNCACGVCVVFCKQFPKSIEVCGGEYTHHYPDGLPVFSGKGLSFIFNWTTGALLDVVDGVVAAFSDCSSVSSTIKSPSISSAPHLVVLQSLVIPQSLVISHTQVV